jgi:hypothetical protein
MPFGLTNAPSTFQSLMNKVFHNYLREFVLVFFDDILVYSSNWAQHMEHVKVVLEILVKQQLYIKRSKCIFGQQEVQYLGHVISPKGVGVDPEKVEAIKTWPKPKTLKAMHGFLGLTGYYRRFIQDYGKIAAPLNRMLKKNNFTWTVAAEGSFDNLKQVMIRAPVLALSDFSKEFVVECDASGVGIGAVLQQERPIAFLSQALQGNQLLLSTYEKEILALVMAVQKWWPYLLGRHFVVRSDQHSLKYLWSQKISTTAQQRWLYKLMGFDFSIEYKKGKENTVADALSQRDEKTGEKENTWGCPSGSVRPGSQPFVQVCSFCCH